MVNLGPPNVQGSNPVEKDRRPTDKQAIFLLSFIPILWFAINVHSALYSHESIEVTDFTEAMKKAKSLMANPIKSVSDCIIFLLMMLLSTGISCFSLWLLNVCTKFFILCILLASIFSLHSLGSLMTTDAFLGICLAFESFFPFLISLIAAIPSLCIIGMNPTSGIIKNSCRVVANNPSLILISSLFMVLEYFLLVFMLHAFVTVAISDRSNINLLFYSNFYGGIVMLSITSKFGRTVLSEYTVNCYWENGEKPSIGGSIARTGRCHIGTVMISSIWPISYFCTTVEAIKHKPAWEKKEHNFFYLISKILLVWQMHREVLIFTSIYGTDYLQSVRKALDSVLRRCKLYLATTWMTHNDFLALKNLFPFIFSVLTALYAVDWTKQGELAEISQEKWTDLVIPRLYLSILGIIVPPILLLSLTFTVAEALLINQIIILNNQD